jgi:hypothetical protein
MKKLFIVVGILLAGCNNFDPDVNVTPNDPSKASGTQLLANAMRYMPDIQESVSGQLYAQHWSEAEYITLSRYDNVFYNFYDWYTEPLMNCREARCE